MKPRFLCVFVVFLTIPAAGLRVQGVSLDLTFWVLRGGLLIDGTGAEPVKNSVVVIEIFGSSPRCRRTGSRFPSGTRSLMSRV